MEMQSGIDIDVLLLARYFVGGITAEERAEVDRWINRCEENGVVAKEFCHVLYASDALTSLNRTNARIALAKVRIRIRRRKRVAALKKGALTANLVLFIFLLALMIRNAPPRDEAVRFIEMHSNPGLISSVELPDGTKVWLNSGSHIKYPATFARDVREVHIDGEAYFQVAKDAGKRFLVHLRGLSVEALGTEFNVDGYGEKQAVTTTLVEGSVCMWYKNDRGANNRYMMKPGDQAVYDMDAKKIKIQPTYLPKDIAWKEGRVLFRNTPFGEALWILSKRFNVDFTVKKKALYDASFTGSFTDQSLVRILEYFRISSGIQYAQKQAVTADGEIQKTEVELY